MAKNNPATEVLVIAGPTASGKSDVAMILAQRLNTEIISADSMQVYRGLDIGTAKPSEDDRNKIKHHMIDVAGFDDPFDVYEYQKRAREAIDSIIKKNKMAILAGGTGLYIRAVIEDLKFPPRDEKVRSELEEFLKERGEEALLNELRKVDPATAKIVDPKNTRRVIRALEVYKITGKPFSETLIDWASRETVYNTKIFFIHRPRGELYTRINHRVDDMIENGLVDETRRLIGKNFRNRLTSTQAIGYKEIIDFIDGKKSLEEAVGEIKTKTRRYAKRQITWFRPDPRVTWVDTIEGESSESVANKIMDKLKE